MMLIWDLGTLSILGLGQNQWDLDSLPTETFLLDFGTWFIWDLGQHQWIMGQ